MQLAVLRACVTVISIHWANRGLLVKWPLQPDDDFQCEETMSLQRKVKI
jgi:hypothetical protein